ncbi:IPT/TIG domain-containing protein [Lysinibacter cavernae]|uniref:Gram-positive cocci surface proteins LPxTG domain-containing protein n=1 Tax=Lysinibacter cavernae TaxID=1640652 RepID=A0A7X5R146_9MICO|nr:IPT/TIG domain-containing protein [Lysinibacter cavernae]NIH53450.1 hypothetical protein [Lysinibacter cavernae]
MPAQAASTDRAESEGLMLSGGGLINLDTVAELEGAYSNGVASTNPLDLDVLRLLNLDLGNGIRLFNGQDTLTLGAVGQYASTSSTQSIASSGLIGSDGSIAAGTGTPGENSSLNLTSAISAIGAQQLISELKLELGALSARASVTPGAPNTANGTYQIASGKLRLTSPALADLTGDLDATLGDTSTVVNNITGTGGALSGITSQLSGGLTSILNGLLGGLVSLDGLGVTGTVNLDLAQALSSVTQQTFVKGPVTIDLSTGEILIDLNEVQALNSAGPNTQLLSGQAVADELSEAISDILTVQLPTALTTAVTNTLNSTAMSVHVGATVKLGVAPLQTTVGALSITASGTVGSFLGNAGQAAPTLSLAGTNLLGLPVADLVAPLTDFLTDTLVPAVGGVLTTALDLDGLETEVSDLATDTALALSPLLNIVNQIVSITINVQEEPGSFREPTASDAGSFTQRALSLVVLPQLSAIKINLASATVRTTALALPTVTSVAPNRGPETGGTSVTITGTNLTGTTGVTIGGAPATSVVVQSATSITAVTPEHSPGAADVIVTNADGPSSPGTFTYYPVTTIDSVTPNSGPEAGGQTVTILGHCFTGATAVSFGATPATAFTVVSDTEITTTAPAGAGVVDVNVAGLGECGTGTMNDAFTYVAPGSPIVASLAPDRGPVTGGTVVTITGTDFTGATGATFDGAAGTAFDVVSDTEITVTSPAHTLGAVDVVVNKTALASVPQTFIYFATTAVDEVTPGSGPESGGTTVTITGTCFTGATGVFFGTTPATSFTVDSNTQITAVAPAGTGTVDIRVTGTTECGNGQIDDGYEYIEPAAITSLDPVRGPEAGGTGVTIAGTGFTDADGVTFGGTAGTAFTVVSDTEITVTSPAHTAGPVDVIVSKTGGNSEPSTFTYYAVSAINSVNPASGPEAGGTSVTITGKCFTGATAVAFGGNSAASFLIVSDTEITAVTPAGSGSVNVRVVGIGDCGEATLTNGFTYVVAGGPDAVIASIAPNRGPESGGTTVTITGDNFTGATGVTVDGVPATSFTVVSDTSVTAVTPQHDPGTVPVVVTHDDNDSNPAQFTYYAITEIDAVNPPVGPESGGVLVTITGHCFTEATGVFFGDVPAGTFTVVNDTTITATEPAGTGVVDIRVEGAGECGSGLLDDAFTYVADGTPIITGITPTRGPDTGGTVVTIAGSGFTEATGVTFDGDAGVNFTVNSDTTITVTSPKHVAATVPVVVEAPDAPTGAAPAAAGDIVVAALVSNPANFTYYAADGGTNGGNNGGGNGGTGGSGNGTGGGSGGARSLAVTGASDTFGALGAAGLLLVAGLTLVIVRRRRMI